MLNFIENRDFCKGLRVGRRKWVVERERARELQSAVNVCLSSLLLSEVMDYA